MQSVKTPSGFLSRRVLFVLASLLLAALLLFLFLPRNTGAYRAVPAQTSLLLESKGLLRTKVLIEKTRDPRCKEVLEAAPFQRCFADAEAAMQLFKHNPALFKAFVQNKALAAWSLHPADSLHALFALELETQIDLEKELKVNKLTTKYFPHQYHGNTIYSVYVNKTEPLEVAVSGSVLLFSHRATLVEDALSQLENAHNWWTDRPYIEALADAPIKLQLRPGALAEQYRGQMLPRWRDLPDLLARNLEWLGLSWDGKKLETLLETKGFLHQLSAWGSKGSDRIYTVLPDNTAFMARVGLSHIPDFFRELGGGRLPDFETYVMPWVGDEAALVVTEPLSPGLSGDRFLLLAVRDSQEAVHHLHAFGEAYGMLPGETGKYQMFDIMAFQHAALLKPMLGNDEAFRNPVCAMVGSYVVFAPDRSSLEILLDKYLVNQTLTSNTDFLQLQQNRPEQGSAAVLLNTAYLSGLLQNLFQGIKGHADLGFISAELQPVFGQKTRVNLRSQPISMAPVQTDILWKTLFGKPVVIPPYLVSQPNGKTFALIQDLDNKLHCLDIENGSESWSRSLPDRILSEIVGLDFYGNGSNCYTFSTAKHLFTLDENGRDVAGFPFKLSSDARNGVTVVDFDRNTKFSYFLACENGKLYGFGHQGKPLDGWNGIPMAGQVHQPMLHFQHKSKDYLAVLTDSGLLSVFGRDGSLRFEPVQLGEQAGAANENATPGKSNFISPMQVDAGAATPKIYCANTSGKIFACDLQGNSRSIQAGNTGNVAAFGPLDKDAAFEWVAYGEKALSIGSWASGLTGKFSKAQFPDKNPLLFIPEKGRIGLVDTRSRRVWMLDNRGAVLPGFPLGGNTLFRFAQVNGVNVLVVGNANGVWAYRLR